MRRKKSYFFHYIIIGIQTVSHIQHSDFHIQVVGLQKKKKKPTVRYNKDRLEMALTVDNFFVGSLIVFTSILFILFLS